MNFFMPMNTLNYEHLNLFDKYNWMNNLYFQHVPADF